MDFYSAILYLPPYVYAKCHQWSWCQLQYWNPLAALIVVYDFTDDSRDCRADGPTDKNTFNEMKLIERTYRDGEGPWNIESLFYHALFRVASCPSCDIAGCHVGQLRYYTPCNACAEKFAATGKVRYLHPADGVPPLILNNTWQKTLLISIFRWKFVAHATVTLCRAVANVATSDKSARDVKKKSCR